MMKENKTELEQKIDTAIELFRKDSNTTFLEIAKLVKAALLSNKHSEKPVSELEVLQKMAKERTKAITIYEKADRKDLAIQEVKELSDTWKEVKDEWTDTFSSMPVEVLVEVNLRHSNLTSKPIKVAD